MASASTKHAPPVLAEPEKVDDTLEISKVRTPAGIQKETTGPLMDGEVGDKEGVSGDEAQLGTQTIDEHGKNHTIFTGKEKGFIIFLATFAAFFSPASGSIYFPALQTLADALGVSLSLINLSITTYLIMQGLAPSFFGTWSDGAGRRPLYLICLTVYILANIGLALQTNYAALIILRLLQSAGSSPLVSLAQAVVADIATTAERGRYISYVYSGAIIGPAVAPIIGGLLIQYLGWRSVFWFLAILAGISLTVITLFFPETCRNVVGDGSIAPQRWNISLLAYYHQRQGLIKSAPSPSPRTIKYQKFPNPLASLKIIADKESGSLLLCSGILNAGYQMVSANLSEELQTVYGYNTVQVGLCFIPFGAGAFLGTLTNGRLIDWNFRRLAALHGLDIKKGRQQDLSLFPIERARLQIAAPFFLAQCVCLLIYGWLLEYQVSVAGPLCMLFGIGWTLLCAGNVMGVLVMDLNLRSPATTAASMNLVRCWMGAGAVSFVGPLVGSVGIGWCGTLVVGLELGLLPVLWWVERNGLRLRGERMEKEGRKVRDREREERSEARDVEGRA